MIGDERMISCSKKHLVLTNLNRKNKAPGDDEVLLGDWCEYPLCLGTGNSLWCDLNLYKNTSNFVDELYEDYIVILSNSLNQFHNTKHTEMYWRIIIGPWLYRFISAFVDRYCHIENVLNCHMNLTTEILDSKDYIIPFDTASFRTLIQSNLYNWQLLSSIVSQFPIETKTLQPQGKVIKLYYKNLLYNAANRRKSIYLHIGENGKKSYIREELMSKDQVENCIKKEFCSEYDVEKNPIRFTFAYDIHDFIKVVDQTIITNQLGHMKKILSTIIPHNIPLLYTIYFEKMLMMTKLFKADQIINDYWHEDEVLKFVAAEIKESKGKIIAINPGGFLGGIKNEFTQTHEMKIADTYFNRGPYPGCVINQIIPVRKRILPRGKENSLLFVSSGFHQPYVVEFASIPTGNTQIKSYYAKQKQFIKTLSQQQLERVRYRAHPRRENIGFTQEVAKLGIKMDCSKNLWDALSKAKLVVIDHVSSSIVEILLSNKPFLIYFDMEVWQVSDLAKNLLVDLEKNNLYFNEPIKAAKYVNTIIENIDQWWLDKTRQQIVREIR